QIIQVSADGMVMAGNVGTATITVINGPAEKVGPVIVRDAVVGPVAVGTDGAVIAGTDGSMVMVAPGSVTSNTTMAIAAVSQASLPMPVPADLTFFGGFQLDFGGQTLVHPVQPIVPAPPGPAIA